MAEFDELNSFLKTLTRNVRTDQEYMQELQEALSLIEQAYIEINKTGGMGKSVAGQLRNPTVTDALATLDTLKREFPNILVDEIVRAAQTTKEYSNPILLEPLVNAANSPENIQISLVIEGDRPTIKVEIDMNSTAGSLEEWANAVTQYRSILSKGKTNKNDPTKSSNYWKNIVYNGTVSDLYVKTIKGRMGFVSGLAPYWKLLNDGNVSITMSSNKGGFSYPSNTPSRFIDKAINKMVLTFNGLLARTTGVVTNSTKKMETQLKRLSEYYDLIQKLIVDLENLDIEKVNQVKAYLDSKNIIPNIKAVVKLIVGLQNDSLSETRQIGLGVNINTGTTYRTRVRSISSVFGSGVY